ncbi:hypothetical protein ruthe_02046 [Rubellimicrobium thermophilum DSM 16684]|uniref:Uncharacterized protein n=1 Tax=Rubellimicrobium thermophilum DSM 16684 TaxID=1123069 RepID=S9QTK9_9RHOB|nr:hypothetical protein [Rubellimicrobium thermophilum]EPX84686.1 hypothetical protein ruthe_02046 [Rubellimicrobium thermophilum DSM 16684]
MRRFLPALPLLLLLAAPLAAQTPAEQDRDRGFLTGLIEDALSSSARSVVIEGFEGALSSRASVESLIIADREGVWFRAEDLVLDWNRSALLRGRIEVQELSAGRIEIIRPPLPDPALPRPRGDPLQPSRTAGLHRDRPDPQRPHRAGRGPAGSADRPGS